MAEEPSLITSFDPDHHRLPLNLIKSDTIPPSPNLSKSGSSAIDWLPDFAGHSWISYGASSLLVISHFPSPLSSHTRPIFRQVLELHSSSSSADVVAVSWSPAIPSCGDLAGAADNCVFLFQYDSSLGSFCWRQTALLVQSAKVEAIAWTGSGDGIISVGTEVVLWKRSIKSWEIAWKFRMKVPQTLVSATWSLEGPSATGVFPAKHHTKGSATLPVYANNNVSVFQYDGKSGYVATELRHPQPVSAILWRPCGGHQLKGDVLYVPRHVLLTSCLDGAVRLWCEFDCSRTRKGNKDHREMSTARQSFCVVAVIEINRSLGGILGEDVFLDWALEIEGIVPLHDGLKQLCTAERCQSDEIGSCEWLIGVGPGQLLTFWSVHCLDDIATMRSPRVTLWKRLEVTEPDLKIFCRKNGLNSPERYCYNKVAIQRNRRFGPPVICSLVKLYPDNSLTWSTLYDQSLQKVEGNSSHVCEADDKLSCQSGGILNTLGHTGKILQVAVHPFMQDVELAVSLDADGLLLFWSISTSSYSFLGLPTLTPSWKLLEKLNLQDTMSQHMCLYWVPSWLEEDQILLIGHAQGIDCLIVKTSITEEDKIRCHKLCTIPFTTHDHLDGLCKLSSIPLHSTCKENSSECNHFLLLCVWMKNCQFESLEVTLHSHELSENGHLYNRDTESNAECRKHVYKADFAGKTYCMVVSSCSSYLPDVHDEVTSLSVASPSTSMHSLHHRLVNDPYPNDFSYHIATGHSDGSSRLWRINLSGISIGHIPVDLVGMFNLLQCPVSAISVADRGQKIATVSMDGHENNVSMLYIWEPLHLMDVGTLVLEDKICLQGKIVALNWFQMENILFLGVCFENELRIYTRRVCSVHSSLNLQEASTWVCIGVARTSLTICDFIVGPSGSLTIVHENFFTLFSHWLFFTNNKYQTDHQLSRDALSVNSETDMDSPTSFVGKINIFEELPFEESNEEDIFCPPSTKVHIGASFLSGHGTQPIFISSNKYRFFKMTVVAEKLCGPLPFYHPEVLLMNIYSGHWRRAYTVVCHLVDCLTSNSTLDQRMSLPASSISIKQIKLSKYFEGQLSKGANQGIQWSSDLDTNTWTQNSGGLMNFTDTFSSDATKHVSVASATSFEPSIFPKLLERMHPHQAVTDLQKMQMLAIVDLLHEICNSQSTSAYESLDDSGKRFWCAIRLQQLDLRRKYGRTPSIEELVVDSRLMVWAFHSDCQEILFRTILSTESSWEDMRKLGVGFWFTNLSDLRNKMEKLARSQYLKNKDPKACALLYIALNRLQVLAGLCKISKDEKDKPLATFLSRNFQDEKHRAAAVKNAYVLMGRHQYELAIAFFLLGGDIISAVTVCAKTLGDEQLALIICRLIEGQGGPSEHHLISKILLPSAIEKGDNWLASVLQWLLGCYLQSILVVLGLQEDFSANGTEELLKHAAFLDPSIGQYCQMLAAKNCLRNAVGEKNTAILCRWSTLVTVSAFNKHGLPLDGLECLSSSASILGVLDKRRNGGDSDILPRILCPSPADSFPWLSNEVSCSMSYQVKLDLAVQYVVKLVKEHPLWLNTRLVLTKAVATGTSSPGHEISEYDALCEDFEQLLISELEYLEQKFSVLKDVLLAKIYVPLFNFRVLLSGYHGFTSRVHMPATSHTNCISSGMLMQFINVTKHLSYSFSRFVIASSIASSWTLASSGQSLSVIKPYYCFHFLEFYMQGFLLSISSLKTGLMTLCKSNSRELVGQYFAALDLCKYCIYFASAMLQHNLKALDVLLRPFLVPSTDGNCEEIDIVRLRIILGLAVEALSSPDINDFPSTQQLNQENEGDTMSVTSEDEKWIVLRFCLWQHLFKFVECQLNQLSRKLSCDVATSTSAFDSSLSDGDCFLKHVREALTIFIETIGNTFAGIPSHIARQLASFLWQKVEDGTFMPVLLWLENFDQSAPIVLHGHQYKSSSSSEALASENSRSELLEKICDCPKTVSEMLAQIPIKLSELIHCKGGKGWNDLRFSVFGELEKPESYKQEGIFDGSPRAMKSKSPSSDSEQNHSLLDSDRKGEIISKKIGPFKNPKEICRRNGELLEAFCINSIDQQQAALASNRKGISYFSWGDGFNNRDPSDYIWAQADWPHNGWAGTESTPVSACVPPGVSIGSDRSMQPGLGSAAVGVSSQARIGRDLTGGGAFGIPGYAGIGATVMGWDIPEEFENFDDPPATLSNVMGSALAAHPSRPFFLVGSSNTHIYLWEFGEEKAVATYGVLSSANIPPPYALASVTGLQLDCFGHRFASSASDGTVSAWQLEVGGRTNVRPTESSLCFNGHVSDVCYVATSGSIIAAAGYSSNGVNVVIWDTLAPPSSSRASVMCHEGGACSIAVFDNDVGTGSISPLIVTGGKAGDIGLHDFRYIATGKTKRQRHLSTVESITDTATIDVRSELSSSVGDHNRHGMLWYIPKAHSASVTKISTIPNTSFFLTGSKDGDVKLWDAKKARLVFHWPKLHERHTFLNRSSQSFGGVARVGVTDIQVTSDGFLTCGGDGLVKLIQLNNSHL